MADAATDGSEAARESTGNNWLLYTIVRRQQLCDLLYKGGQQNGAGLWLQEKSHPSQARLDVKVGMS